MYHPAKVEQVIDAEDGPVLMVQTWDQNTFTVNTADRIQAADVAEGDVVLLDYYPDEQYDMPKPKQIASHVLDGEEAEAVWETYEQQFEAAPDQATGMQQQVPQQAFDGNYIG
ncbi:MAG: hypothetical protein SV186_06690 [Candidatus Nanohaloarchaea archaeon]|nr:hypothetical protein [Candidatus Nanohaloarchaea archaeon]